jgi:hypothetical protein
MTTFADVEIGETFRANGITAVKQSSRTGKVLAVLICIWAMMKWFTLVKIKA